MIAKDLFSASTEIAVMAKNWGKLPRTPFGDAGNGAKENREANREDALFAPRKNPAAKIEGAERRFFDGGGAQILGNESNLFRFFGRGRNGFAKLRKAEHAEEQYRMERRNPRGDNWACLGETIHAEWRRLKRFNKRSSRKGKGQALGH